MARTGLVTESLVPSVLEQRITTGTAHCTRRRLLNRYGEKPRARSLGGDADPAVGRRLADGAEPGVAPGRSSRDPARLLLRPAPGRSRRHDFAGGDDPPSTRSRHRRVDRRRRNAATYPWRPDALPSATSTCPSRSATPAAAPTSRCFSCWSRTEGSATAPPSSCSGGCRQPAAGCRTAGPTGQPHRPSAARPRGAAFGRVRVRRCRASCRSRCRGLR